MLAQDGTTHDLTEARSIPEFPRRDQLATLLADVHRVRDELEIVVCLLRHIG
jgi:hypothetical protein